VRKKRYVITRISKSFGWLLVRHERIQRRNKEGKLSQLDVESEWMLSVHVGMCDVYATWTEIGHERFEWKFHFLQIDWSYPDIGDDSPWIYLSTWIYSSPRYEAPFFDVTVDHFHLLKWKACPRTRGGCGCRGPRLDHRMFAAG
jgi:hypothetical protein